MIWNIMIITKDYDEYVEMFRQRKEYIDYCKFSKDLTDIYSGFTHIVIMNFISPYQFRGYRAHLVYIDDDLINDKELKAIILPCIIQGNRGLLPISYLDFMRSNKNA